MTSTALRVEELEKRVDQHWDELITILDEKIAGKAVSALGISRDTMKESAEFVARRLREVGVDAHIEQALLPDGQ